MTKIGLIAGNGQFPRLFAKNARRLGYSVSAVAHTEETDPNLEEVVDHIHWVKLGQLGRLIKALKDDGITKAVMIGGVKKTHFFSKIRPDMRGLALLRRVGGREDDLLLRAIAEELATEGIEIIEQTFGLTEVLADEGVLTARKPKAAEKADIDYGWDIVKEIGRMDIGQCVVVKDNVIVAVETVEGTDITIERGGRFAKAGASVIKRSKLQQDLRFDLPTVGPQTVKVMKEVGATALALEAGKCVMLEKSVMLSVANKAGITVVGLPT
ncbi:MAG: hypothetical protein CMH81_04970 [Nitrospiraceae bacterium]|nr:hypothetical protein [Nitrospiraceae bacterium]|tara:strand:+ start:3006 stop:3812 length:807 start_codon:yes stop_codon:yes gene_type:complete